jgi:CheY-like chemotaxis protein
VAVIDTGSGYRRVKAHLFEPIFTTKPRGQGTGLGWPRPTAHRQSGGVIEVESELGRGTTFRILLRRFPRSRAAHRASPSARDLGPRTGDGLVVEDDPGVREVAARALLASGYRVLTAVTGEEALALAATEPIHLLLTDVVMPGMNGRELAARLLALHTDTRVLYTSGYAEDIIAHHGVLDAGVELLSKPYSIDVLIRRVRRVLDHR